MKIGIVGHEDKKFTPETREIAKQVIKDILSKEGVITVVSGHSPLDGVDIYVEEIAVKLGLGCLIFKPEVNQWNPYNRYGFRARNLDIAKHSDELYNIVVEELPSDFKGMKFDGCYHCGDKRPKHVKSGGCWTAIQFEKIHRKEANWVII